MKVLICFTNTLKLDIDDKFKDCAAATSPYDLTWMQKKDLQDEIMHQLVQQYGDQSVLKHARIMFAKNTETGIPFAEW